MSKAVLLCLFLPSLIVAQVPTVPPMGVPDVIRDRVATDLQFQYGLILIAFQGGTSSLQKDSALSRISGRVVGGLPVREAGLDGWYVVRLEASEPRLRSAQSAGQELAYLPWVHMWTSWNHRVEVALDDLLRPEPDPVGDVLAVHTRARSVWGDIETRFAPFESSMKAFRIDRADPSGDGRPTTVWALESAMRPPSDSVSVHLLASSEGGTEILQVPEWEGEPGIDPREELIRTEPDAFLVPFLFGPSEEEDDVTRWTHRVVLGSDGSPLRGRLEGERVISLIGDSAITGAGRLRIVRDSAKIAVRRSWGTYDYGFGDTIRLSEDLEGVIRGVASVGPAGLVSSRQDTIVLHGQLRGEFPDGRVVEVPLRWEAERTVVRQDPGAYLVEFSDERSPHGSRATARSSELALGRRLSEGDPAATDSVLGLWRSTADPEQRQRLFGLVGRTLAGVPISEFREALLQEGDTAHWLDLALTTLRDPKIPPMTVVELEQLLPFLDQPDRVWRIGRSGRAMYSNAMSGLSAALPAITPDTASWAFTPRAFELLASWRDRAEDPRLRDFATFAWFALDPEDRYSRLAARGNSDAATLLARQALRLADGAARPGNPDQPTVPTPDAPVVRWAEWAGTASGLGQVRITGLDLFKATHPHRDLGSEVAGRYRDATREEERALFLDIGRRLGALPLPAPEEVVVSVAEGDTASSLEAVVRLLMDAAQPAPDSIALSILDRLLAWEADGLPLWDTLGSQARSDGPPGTRRTEERENTFLLDRGLPEALVEAWSGRISIISREEWDAMDPRRSAHLLSIGEILVNGPLVRLSFSRIGRLNRAPSERPHTYASGSTMYLARRNSAWWVLMPGSGWIT